MTLTVIRTVAVILVVAALAAFYATAAPTGGQTTAGAQERAPDRTAGNTTIGAGNITQVNVSGNTITTRWAGFYGEVSGGITLADASDNVFYQWAVSDPTGSWIYASNGTVSDWSSANIGAVSNLSHLPGYLRDSSGDNYTSTFSSSGSFNSSSLDIPSVNYAASWQNGTQTTNFTTYSLQTADNSTLIWAGSVVANAESFKTNSTTSVTTDYQILAPADTTGQQYYFYLEFK